MNSSNYIAGQWVEGKSLLKNIHPSDTTDIIDEYTSSSSEQFEQAVQSAISAQTAWQKVGLDKPSPLLLHIGAALILQSLCR